MAYIDPDTYDQLVEDGRYDDTEQMLEDIGIRCEYSNCYYDDINDFDEELRQQGVFVAKEFVHEYVDCGGGSVEELRREHGSVYRTL